MSLFEERACILKKMANGMSRAEAEASCARPRKNTLTPARMRDNGRAVPSNMPWQSRPALGQMGGAGPLKTGPLKTSMEHNIAQAGGATLGTNAVVRDEPIKAAAAWKKSIGPRRVTKNDRAAWGEYAKRMNMTPEDEKTGWAAIEWAENVFSALRAVFEATSWWGYSVPNIGMIKMQGTAGPASAKAPDAPAWGPVASWPFHTEVAGKVWDSAKKMIQKYKFAKPLEILRFAIDDSKVFSNELTPEDAKLLELAISWAQNGAPKPVAKMSGAPGGPFNSTTGSTGAFRRGPG
jgi:hypothetical protein